MKMSKENREVITSTMVLLLSIALCIASGRITIKNETYTQSARIFPQIISGVMVLLSTLYVISSWRRSRDLTWERVKNSAAAFVRSKETRRILLAILLVGVYIFLGVQKGRFYISSLIFMLVILLIYVRKIKPWIAILASALFIAGCWLLFFKLFSVQLY